MLPRRRLDRLFFDRPTTHVARDLLGCVQECIDADGQQQRARIVETEAYVGTRDRACHASRGRTPRTEVMFGPPGHAYVYLIYGMYCCFNVVTRPEGRAEAVLVRAAEPITPVRTHLSGPGALCRGLAIDRTLNGADLCIDGARIWIEPREGRRPRHVAAPRVNIDYAGPWARRLWRFCVEGCVHVSHPRPWRRGRAGSCGV